MSQPLRSLLWLILVIFMVTLAMPAAQVQAVGSANFTINPPASSVQQNEIFTIDIKVDASTQPVDGAQAYINFDPNYLRVVDAGGSETNQITNGELYNTVWPDVLANTVNNSTGQIGYAAGKGTTGSSASTLFTLATIRFKAVATISAPGTAIIFSTSVPRATKAAYGLDTVTGTMTGGTVTISAAPAPYVSPPTGEGAAAETEEEEGEEEEAPPTIEEIEEMPAEDAAEYIKGVAPEIAADIIEQVTVEKGAGIIEKITTNKAADIIEQVTVEKGAGIIEKITTNKAADIIEKITTEKSAGIIEQVSTEKGVGIIEKITTNKATGIIEKVTTEKGAGIMEKVVADKAATIMERLTTKKLTSIITAMSETSLTERLPEVFVDKLYSVEPRVLFESVPNAPTEQLVGEKSPQPATGIELPTMVATTPAGARYRTPQSVAGGWAVVVSTPPPVDQLMLKTRRALANIETTLEVFAERPSEITLGLPAEQIAQAYINITFENVAPEDIELGHMTFKVEKAWLEQNHIHKWSVALNRYDPELGQWIPLPTKRVKEDSRFVYYTTVITHFSTFVVSGSQTLPPLNFKVANPVISPVEAKTGEVITISADINNLSDKASTYVATLWLNRTIETGKDVYLQAGETRTVSFNITRDAEGIYEVRFDRLFGSFSVREVPAALPAPAAFAASDLSITPAKVDIGEEVTVSVVVSNTGEATGSYQVTLKVDNVVVATEDVTLAGGASQTVTFTASRDAAGTYSVNVDGLSGTFTVKAPPVPPKPINWWLIGGIIAAVVVIGVVAFLVVRR